MTPLDGDARVAEIAVDLPLPHLDRPFDYLVPAEMHESLVPGVRVKVRFAGRDRDGWVLGTRPWQSELDAARRLIPVRRLVSPVPVLTDEVMALARVVADRYAGTFADVIRFAVPPRHARTEASVARSVEGAGADPNRPPREPPAPSPGHDQCSEALVGATGGQAFLDRLAQGQSPRAVWTVLGGPAAWRTGLCAAVRATRASGRGVVVVVPDADRVDTAVAYLASHLGEEVGRLVAGDGPSRRVRAHLRALHGLTPIVVGTRSAAWAPVVDVGLVVCWDDGDDLLLEQRSPYPHAAQVLALRAERAGAAALFASPARSTWAAQLVATGWAASLRHPRDQVRARAPRVLAPGASDLAAAGPGESARIPTPAWRTARDALAHGPVLVQVPRSGYVPAVVCDRCRTPARCAECAGPLLLEGPGQTPRCGLCGRGAAMWACPECQGTALRAARIGSVRTAEELGRAFPQVPVLVTGHGHAVATVDGSPRLVISTPGAEPEATAGYAAALLLDAWLATSIPGLGAGEEAVRRWFAAACLVRPAQQGGRVMIVGGGADDAVQALVRWDPVTYAERALGERNELRFPPAARWLSATGPRAAVRDLLAEIELPEGAELVGTVPVPAPEGEEAEWVRSLLRAPRSQGVALALAARAGLAVRSAHKRPGPVRLQVDPRELA